MLRWISTQSEFWRQVARAAPVVRVLESGLVKTRIGRVKCLRMSLHEDGMFAK